VLSGKRLYLQLLCFNGLPRRGCSQKNQSSQFLKGIQFSHFLGNSEIDVSGDDSDNEDALKEIKKNIKKAQTAAKSKKPAEDEEDDDESDESGSGSDDQEEHPKKKTKKASRKEEIEKIDDSFFDLKH